MKMIFALLLLLAAPIGAQTIAPAQIKPGANGQTIQTVGGKAAWANTAAGVTSFGPAGFPRTGVIIPATGDYNCSQVTSAICSLPTVFNQLLKVDGAALTQRGIVNFINGSAGTVTCVDNPVSLATDCTFTGGSTTGVSWNISDVSGSNSVGTAKQNTSLWPMFVGGSLVTTGSGTGSITVAQGPSAFSMTLIDWKNQSTATVSSGSAGFTAVIKPGYWYVVQVSGAVTTSIQNWTEMVGSGSGGGGGGFTAAGDLSGTSSSQTVVGLDSVPFCSGYAPTNGQFIELTTGGSPNPCYTATTPSGSGNTTSTSLTTNRLPKANGANSIIDSSVSDNGTTVSTTEPVTAPAVNAVINAGSSLSAAVTACGSALTTIQITQTIAVGTGITVPANCTLLFQSAGNLTGTSITINGTVQAPPVQIFASGLAVTGMKNFARPEWWGAIPYSSVAAAAAGANDVAKAQQVFTALSGGGVMELQCAYYHIGGLVITHISQGIEGECPGGIDGVAVSQPFIVSTIVDSSATETIVDAHGTSPSVVLSGLSLKHFAVQRSVLPTGTARGFSLSYLNQPFVEDVSSADSIDNFYMHQAGNNGVYTKLVGVWGFSVVSGASYTAPVHAFNFDSADGNGENTLALTNSLAVCPLVSVVSTGLLVSGATLSDILVDNLATGTCSYGIDFEGTGSTSGVAQDIKVSDSVLNASTISALKINNVLGSANLAGTNIQITGSDLQNLDGTSCVVDIENSRGILLAGGNHVFAEIPTCINGSIDIGISGNIFNFGALFNNPVITGSGSSSVSITGNTINSDGTGLIPGAAAISLASTSVNWTISGNTFSNNFIEGVLCDGTSTAVVGLNSFDSFTSTHYSGAGCQQAYSVPIVLTTAGSSGASTFNPATGALNIPTYAGGGSATIIQVNGTPTSTATPVNLQNSSANVTGLTETVSNPSVGNVKTEIAGTLNAAHGGLGIDSSAISGYPSDASGTWSIATAAATFQTLWNTVVSTTGAMIYGGAGGIPTNLSSPTTSGHTFALAWQPSGSAIAPTALDLATYLGAPPAIGGTTPNTSAFTTEVLGGNGAASTPVLSFTGAWFSGGTATTTKPQLLVEQSTATSTGWGTQGTGIGVNSAASFTGNLIDAQNNGVSKFKADYLGNTNQAGSSTIAGTYNETGTGNNLFAGSLLVAGTLDGAASVTITTGSTATLGGTFKSGYTFNNEGTTSAAVTYTLPAAVAGLQYCVANLPTETGVLTLQTSGTGQFIGRAGAYGTTGGHAASGGALGDAACVIGVDATHWLLYPQTGTWVNP